MSEKLIKNQIRLEPIVGDEMWEAVHKAAQENDEGVMDPTHAVIRDGEIIGAISINVSCASWWMHTQKTGYRDSYTVLQILDSLMLDRQIFRYVLPCEESSPYHGIMERNGFKKILGNWTLFVRNLMR